MRSGFWQLLQVVSAEIAQNRVGVLGHYYGGMMDVYSDLTQQSAAFGNHFELLEIDELKLLRDQATEQQIRKKLDQFHRQFYLMDFKEDLVFLGHDGPAHFANCRGRCGAGSPARLSRKTGQRSIDPDEREAGPGHAAVGGAGRTGQNRLAIGIGHIAGKIEKLAQLLDLDFHRVC